MKAVLVKDFGPAENMYIGDTDLPSFGDTEVLVRVKATAINRADVLQRKGGYAPPPGVTHILGLEIAGLIEQLGPKCDPQWKIGDRVASLVSGGGYAQFCPVDQSHLIRLPEQISFTQGASVPEAWMTAYQVLHVVAEIEKVRPEYVVFHAGASGVGVAAIQLANQVGSKVIVTCGSQEKVDFCMQVGAFAAINYKQEDFAQRIQQITEGKGVGILIDCVGGGYFMKNLECMSPEGRIVLIGWLSGSKVPECDLNLILRKRLRIEGSTLRARDNVYKANLAKAINDYCMPRFVDGQMKIIVDAEFPVEKVAEAHAYMEANKNMGKIVMHLC